MAKGEKTGALAKEYRISPSTISTWKKNAHEIKRQANEGVKMNRLRNRTSALPHGESTFVVV